MQCLKNFLFKSELISIMKNAIMKIIDTQIIVIKYINLSIILCIMNIFYFIYPKNLNNMD